MSDTPSPGQHHMIDARGMPPPKRSAFSWRSKQARGVVYQVVALATIGFLIWLLISNTLGNMKARGIQSGFDFLLQPAGFDIGEEWIGFDSNNPYWRAFLAGLVNTLRVALIGIFLTTILGTLLGVGRFSRNALVRGICYGYVEMWRAVELPKHCFKTALVSRSSTGGSSGSSSNGVLGSNGNGRSRRSTKCGRQESNLHGLAATGS